MPTTTQNHAEHNATDMEQSAEDRLLTAKAKQLREREAARKTSRKNPEGIAHVWIGLITTGTFLLLLVGINAISPDSGPVASLRNVVMSVLGAALVYGVGYFSIKIGAERVAAGDRTMLALCLGGFMAAAMIIAPTTYFAMAKKIAVEIELTDHGQDIKASTEAANRVAIESQTIKPIVADGHKDIRDTESCERLRGCLTGKPYAGKGPAPVSDFLGSAANRFGRAVRTMEDAEGRRDGLIRDLNRAGDRYNEVASDRSQNAKDKRKTLIALDSEIRDKLAQLEQVSPSRVLQNLAGDLRSSQDDEIGSRKQRSGMELAEALVRNHAKRLREALAELHADLVPLPPFPGPVSLSSSFSASVLPNTLPYLLLAIFIECSGVFCFLLCVKYHRGRLLDHLALLEMDAQETDSSLLPAKNGANADGALNGAKQPDGGQKHRATPKNHSGHHNRRSRGQ